MKSYPVCTKFSSVLLLILIATPFLLASEKPVFKLIRSIGDERENYMIARFSGVAISNQKEIFIADHKLLNIRKYDWNGKFISKVGQKGKGPGDFLTISGLQWFDNQLLVYDMFNRRITVTDTEMKQFRFIRLELLSSRLKGGFPIRNAPIVLDKNRLLAISSRYDDEMGRLFIFNNDQEIETHFFCQLPKDIAQEKNRRAFSFLTHPIATVNHEKKQILVSFEYPDRDIVFYLYDFSGNLIRQFAYTQEEAYRFPMEALDSTRKLPNQHTQILEILAYKDYYMIFLVQVDDYHKRTPDGIKTNFQFLFFRDTGELVYKMPWTVRFTTITPDGYLGGITGAGGEDKVVIYKFDPTALEALTRK